MTTTLIKTKQRVREHGEVFTPEHVVEAMLDELPADTWPSEENPKARQATFLEPACGTGNFLVAILRRKLAGSTHPIEGITALQSIYAIDILEDNVRESRARLLAEFAYTYASRGVPLNSWWMTVARNVVERNVVVGNAPTELANRPRAA